MKTWTQNDMVAAFHDACDLPIDGEFTMEELKLRMSLIKEEFREVMDAAYDVETSMLIRHDHQPSKRDKAALLSELVDLIYVVNGMAVAFGLPINEAFNRIHTANMSKADPFTGKVIKDENGKVLKSVGYIKADLSDLV